jgi:hypothetical protein
MKTPYDRDKTLSYKAVFYSGIGIIVLILVMVLSSCKGTYYAYHKRNFVPNHQSKVRECMGFPYIGHDVNLSMRYYYSKRKK